MSRSDVDILGIAVHGHRGRYSVAHQKAALGAAHPRAVIEMGADGVTVEVVWKRAAAKRVLVVEWLFLVCTIRGSAKRKRELIHKFVDEVRERQGEIWEVGSGRRTDKAEERRAMLQDAFEAVTRGRMPSMTRHRGRPIRKWTPRQKEIIEAKWLSHAYATNEEAAAAVSQALGFEVSHYMCWKAMRDIRLERGEKHATGASGRPWKKTRKH